MESPLRKMAEGSTAWTRVFLRKSGWAFSTNIWPAPPYALGGFWQFFPTFTAHIVLIPCGDCGFHSLQGAGVGLYEPQASDKCLWLAAFRGFRVRRNLALKVSTLQTPCTNIEQVRWLCFQFFAFPRDLFHTVWQHSFLRHESLVHC